MCHTCLPWMVPGCACVGSVRRSFLIPSLLQSVPQRRSVVRDGLIPDGWTCMTPESLRRRGAAGGQLCRRRDGRAAHAGRLQRAPDGPRAPAARGGAGGRDHAPGPRAAHAAGGGRVLPRRLEPVLCRRAAPKPRCPARMQWRICRVSPLDPLSSRSQFCWWCRDWLQALVAASRVPTYGRLSPVQQLTHAMQSTCACRMAAAAPSMHGSSSTHELPDHALLTLLT